LPLVNTGSSDKSRLYKKELTAARRRPISPASLAKRLRCLNVVLERQGGERATRPRATGHLAAGECRLAGQIEGHAKKKGRWLRAIGPYRLHLREAARGRKRLRAVYRGKGQRGGLTGASMLALYRNALGTKNQGSFR
jgi:hypothetical protein